MGVPGQLTETLAQNYCTLILIIPCIYWEAMREQWNSNPQNTSQWVYCKLMHRSLSAHTEREDLIWKFLSKYQVCMFHSSSLRAEWALKTQ